MQTTKTVCIIGAGPAGLAAAKVLASNFKVTVFEQSDRIGGIWDDAAAEGFLDRTTPTNLSRYTVGFSDLDWNTVLPGASQPIPLFPKAWQVNRYLLAYAQKLPQNTILLGHRVTRTERIVSRGQTAASWLVSTDAKSGEETRTFDYLVLGTGFFSQPRPLSKAVPTLSLQSSNVVCMHSSRFRKLEDLFPRGRDAAGTILVIGGGNSSGETAANIAQQLSNSQYSPNTSMRDVYKDCKIVHVTPRPLYALPPFVPANADYRSFIPLDLKLYDLSRRPPGDIIGNGGCVADTVKNMIHDAMQTTIGGDQSDLGSPALTIPSGEPRSTVHVAISESYPEFVRSGLISVLPGRVTALEDSPKADAIARVVRADSETTIIDNIVAVVFATGFSPHSAVEILPEDVKQALQYDGGSARLPVLLSGWQTMHLDVPDLAFIGFYEGPYWGIIEMQARLTANRWLSGQSPHPRHFEETAKLLDLRKNMKERGLDVPQYWFGDPLGYSEEIARYLRLERNDGPFGEREGCMSPARYLSADTDRSEAFSIMQDLHETWVACKEGRFVARAAFRALQGNWNIHRTIKSALPSFPSGTLEGQASFLPRFPTPDRSGQSFDFEYLYTESGTLLLSNGASMNARRRYVYRYREEDDKLSVWFVKPDHDLEVDYLFHTMAFVSPAEAVAQGACIARADHLCVEDMYKTEYRLPMKGISLLEFETRHTVRGPSKDYVATTKYQRPEGATGV